MKPEQQRITIAKACGWTPYIEPGNSKFFFSPGRKGWKELYHTQEIPDYLNDLNAMHEAVMAQPNDVQWMIFGQLATIVNPDIPAACGEAKDWAKAFLRTLNLWTETT